MNEKKVIRKRVQISKGTMITIIIIIGAFLIWNFVILPRLFAPEVVHQPPQIPTVKRGNISFINGEMEKRKSDVPPLIAPENAIGKTNPFE